MTYPHPGDFGGPDPIGGRPDVAGSPQSGQFGPGGIGVGQPYPPPGFPPAVPRRKISPRLIAAAIVAAVLLAGVAVFLGRSGTFGASSGEANTPGEAVKGYLEALARGDAARALAYAGDKPASTALLTDDILKRQLEQWPISDIRILSEDAYTDHIGTVHVSVKFGEKTSDDNVFVVNNGNGWQLQKATMRLGISKTTSEKAIPTLTLFGKPLDPNTEIYDVFPGWVDIATTNELVTMQPPNQPTLLSELGPTDTLLSLHFEINDRGKQAALDAVRGVIEACVKSPELYPPNCPQGTRDPSLVAGTAKWTLPDLGGIALAERFFNEDELTVPLENLPDFPVTADARSGGTKSGTVYPNRGTVDLTTDPPTVTFR